MRRVGSLFTLFSLLMACGKEPPQPAETTPPVILFDDMSTQDMGAVEEDMSSYRDLDTTEDLGEAVDMNVGEDMTPADPCESITCEHGGACQDGACVCALGRGGELCGQRCGLAFSGAGEPVSTFLYGAGVDDVLWNDPTILPDENGGFVMWLSGGVARASVTDHKVRLYRATSPDGMNWTLNTDPVFVPGEEGAWDSVKVETPSVLRDRDGLYHLYYSGTDKEEPAGVYAIGHATSSDGISWARDPANPVITTATDSDWGVYTAAEPGAIYDSSADEIKLYYVGAGGSADVRGQFAILLATSQDGSSFTHHTDATGNREPVWSLTESYVEDDSFGYRGFSTPSAAQAADGTIYLAHDVVQWPKYPDDPDREPDPNAFEQDSISLARSQDGLSFEEVAVDIVEREAETWYEREVRAPAIMFDASGGARLWFAAGEDLVITGTPPDFIDWADHTESFGVVEVSTDCAE